MLSGQQLELSFWAPVPRLRVCSACGEGKADSEFTVHNKGRCRDCIRAYKRELYRKNEALRERTKAKNLKRINELKSTEEGREIVYGCRDVSNLIQFPRRRVNRIQVVQWLAQHIDVWPEYTGDYVGPDLFNGWRFVVGTDNILYFSNCMDRGITEPEFLACKNALPIF